MAVKNPKILKKACDLFPGRIAVALDVRNNFLAIKGWVRQTKIKLMDFSKKLEDLVCLELFIQTLIEMGQRRVLIFLN